MSFMEVSAKDGTNINQLFEKLGQEIYQQIKTSDKGDKDRISLTKEGQEQSGSSGCRC